ncbi:helix-turn-helix transcriptional regulator [Salinispora tropica]|uniref:helix-turn-helix transcriptional regulator n=1 Tax=Salinispora tropica TaxID=168695 RepID=UPI00048AEF69|nr:WYL domain-containing protein [Salinispora tropica]
MSDDQTRESRVLRLDKLKALLAERACTTAADLAGELGVSTRTLHRDLALLREMGVPVEGDRGTGGGLRLEPGWSLGRVHLNESEALGLLLSLTIAEKVGSPLLLDDLRAITRKVAAAFAPAQARRILALRQRILIGQAASVQVVAGYTAPRSTVTKALLDAFARCRTALMRYEDRYGVVTEREIELQFLYYNLPVWYVLGWDLLRRDIRSFRIDRVQDLQMLSTEFRLRAPAPFLEAGEETARTM